MKRLNNHGISLVEIVVTFAIVMAIISGLLAIIMNYRLQAQNSFSKLELQTYKNNLTKTIQDDILNFGIGEILLVDVTVKVIKNAFLLVQI